MLGHVLRASRHDAGSIKCNVARITVFPGGKILASNAGGVEGSCGGYNHIVAATYALEGARDISNFVPAPAPGLPLRPEHPISEKLAAVQRKI